MSGNKPFQDQYQRLPGNTSSAKYSVLQYLCRQVPAVLAMQHAPLIKLIDNRSNNVNIVATA